MRPRTPADVGECVTLLAQVHGLDGYPLQWPDDPASWLVPEHLVAAWVAHIDNELVGHVALTCDEFGPHLGTAEVSRLFVLPTKRRHGVGVQLLDAAVYHAEQKGWAVQLEVVEGSGSAQFYERQGWPLIDRRPAPWTTRAGLRPILRRYAGPHPTPSR